MINRYLRRWWVYIVRCNDSSLYCGITKDLQRRVEQHNAGVGAKYTRSRRPVRLVWCTPRTLRCDAARLECKIKKMTKARKEALVEAMISEDQDCK